MEDRQDIWQEVLNTLSKNKIRFSPIRGIQDKIDGFDYDNEGSRISNKCPMDESKLVVEYIYEGDILRISDGNHTHEFTVDKNQLVYVDGFVALPMRSARIKDEYYNEVREGTLAHMMSKAKY